MVTFSVPLANNAVMNRFYAEIKPSVNANEQNTIKIVANIEERREAQRIFDNALEEGKSAVLGKKNSRATDAFEISLGGIPANHLVEVQYDYLLENAITETPAEDMRNGSGGLEQRLYIPLVLRNRASPRGQSPLIYPEQIVEDHNALTVRIVCEPKSTSITGKLESGEPRIIEKVANLETQISNTWEVDAVQLFYSPDDLELYIQFPQDQRHKHLRMSDTFEFNRSTKTAIYMTNITPNIDDSVIAEVPKSVRLLDLSDPKSFWGT